MTSASPRWTPLLVGTLDRGGFFVKDGGPILAARLPDGLLKAGCGRWGSTSARTDPCRTDVRCIRGGFFVEDGGPILAARLLDGLLKAGCGGCGDSPARTDFCRTEVRCLRVRETRCDRSPARRLWPPCAVPDR